MKELYKTIEDKLASQEGGKRFAVFDFDNTCIINDIAEATLAYMARNDLFKDRTILPGLENATPRELSEKIFMHDYGVLDAKNIRGAYEFGAKTIGGLAISEAGGLVEKVLNFEGSEITKDKVFDIEIAKGIATRPAVIELIKYLQERNVSVWVVSASPKVLVAGALKYFNINAQLIGVRNVIKNGIVTPELEYPISVIEGKIDCIKLFIDSVVRPILAVGDNDNDLPMLEYSDIKVVINRHNSLAEKAEGEGWFLIEP